MMDKAFNNLKFIKDKVIHEAIRIVFSFNIGYISEMEGDLGKASHMYKDVITKQPYYVDAYLWLAIIAMKNNDQIRALKYVS